MEKGKWMEKGCNTDFLLDEKFLLLVPKTKQFEKLYYVPCPIEWNLCWVSCCIPPTFLLSIL